MTEVQELLHHVTLTAEEHRYLRCATCAVEEHRTRTPSYRELVLRQESVTQGLLDKLRR